MKDIRLLYETFGAEDYYREHGLNYANPHKKQIEALLRRNLSRWNTTSGILDFCAGGGEVSHVLKEANMDKIIGSDPFTYQLYEKNLGTTAEKWSFNDLVKGTPIGQYGLVICSFALHLCPEKDLFPVVWVLLNAAPTLVVLTPHKRPELERIQGIELVWEDYELTERGKKVRLKEYGLKP